jgi:acetyl-CoA decarbonylase/synthase complex subunit delta
MPVERVTEKWKNSVNVTAIGSGYSTINIGGEATLPFLYDEGSMPYQPAIALEIYDVIPEGWSEVLCDQLGDVINDPVAWAKKGQDEWNADLICLRLLKPSMMKIHPEEIAEMAKAIKEVINIPMILWPMASDEINNELYPALSQALAGERCLIASAKQDNYKTLAAICLADGHNIIAESPLDINICKQVNILLSDMGLPTDRIAIYPNNGVVGYGFEYAYSIMERTRIAALGGDRMMAMPMLAVIGSECQRIKEVKATSQEFPQWGPELERGIAWETATAVGYLQAGADILTMCNPEAIRLVKDYINDLMPVVL